MLSGRPFFLFCILTMLAPAALAGHPAYQLYATEDGLPSTFVKHILQLPVGYMAIATDDGLAFYDGYDFHRRCISNGLPDHLVKHTLLSRRNRLYVATDKGIAFADLEEKAPPLPDSFTRIPFTAPDGDYRIRALHETTDGRILAAGQNRVYVLDAPQRNQSGQAGTEDGTGQPAEPNRGTVMDTVRELEFDFTLMPQTNLVRSFSFENDRRGGVLITTAGNNLLYLPPGGSAVVRVANTGLPSQLRGIQHAGGSRYWVGSVFGLYLVTWDPDNRSVLSSRFIPATRGTTVDNMALAPDGTVLAGTDGSGTIRIHPETFEKIGHRSYFSDYIKHIYFDRSGNQWTATDHGIAFTPNVPFGNIGPDEGLPRRYVTGVVRDRADHLWIATHEGFFHRAPGESLLTKPDYLEGELIHSIRYSPDSGRIYAFADGGIHVLDVLTGEGALLRQLDNNSEITASVIVGDRHFWMVTNTGKLLHLDEQAGSVRTLGAARGITQAVSSVTRTPDGLIWISGAAGFLAWYHTDRSRFIPVSWDEFGQQPPENSVFSYIHPGDDTYLWIGSTDGLYRFDPFAATPYFGKVTDLDDGNVRWIRQTGGNLWVGSNRYLYSISHPGTDDLEIRRFSAVSGLLSTNFAHGAVFVDDSGYVWMGTNVGAAFYNNTGFETHTSPVRLRYWSVGDTIFTTTEEQLLDNDTDYMTFAFTTLDFPSGEIVYQSRIAGRGGAWSEPTTNPVFTPFFRGSGRYTFEVRASRSSSNWTEPLSISFVIQRPWWIGNVMLGVYFLIVMAIIFGLIRWNSLLLRKRNKELADGVREQTNHLKLMVRELENEIKQREEVEQELRDTNFTNERMIKIVSHDLRSPFQGILGFASMLQEEYEELDEDERREMLAQIINSSNLAVSLLNQLLDWISLQTGKMPFSPTPQNLAENVKEISDLLKSLADSKDIRLETRVPDDITVHADRNMLQSILRNLVGNAIKFTSRDGKITIEAQQQNSHTEISITDNGVGMEQETLEKILAKEKTVTTKGTGKESGSGLGLVMTKEMIDRHGGVLTGKSKIKRGTTFTFTLPNNDVTGSRTTALQEAE